MAVSDATSSPADWAQIYHQSLSNPTSYPAMFSHSSDSTVVTTISNSTSPAPSTGTIDGRVGKSSRRRSRASRRAPTTLLNTDTTNFRALVQQFTGISAGAYTSGYQTSAAPLINFAGVQQPTQPVGFDLLQQQQYQMQQQQQYRPSEQYSVGGGNGDGLIGQYQTNITSPEQFFFDGEAGSRSSNSW